MGDELDSEADEADELEAAAYVGKPVPVGDPLRDAVIEALGRSSPLLKSGLASSLPWRVEQTKLVIPFRSGMEESVVRGSIADIAAKASELAGRQLKVELCVERKPSIAAGASGSTSPIEGGPDPVAIVERVFRGVRLPDSPRGERDEFH
jgi:hypothetical protein